MTYPAIVTILGQRQEVRVVAESDPLLDLPSTGLSGRYVSGRSLIVVSSETPPDQARETLLHEVLHAHSHLLGLNGREWDEDLVRALTSVLLDTLRRNPELVAFLTEGAA